MIISCHCVFFRRYVIFCLKMHHERKRKRRDFWPHATHRASKNKSFLTPNQKDLYFVYDVIHLYYTLYILLIICVIYISDSTLVYVHIYNMLRCISKSLWNNLKHHSIIHAPELSSVMCAGSVLPVEPSMCLSRPSPQFSKI